MYGVDIRVGRVVYQIRCSDISLENTRHRIIDLPSERLFPAPKSTSIWIKRLTLDKNSHVSSDYLPMIESFAKN